jgi:hypothetical protein
MDQETIQKLAAEIVRYLPSYPWGLLAVQVVLTLLAAAAGAFFGEYFKTRGKNFATKADFDSLLEQLRANTELVEGIKAEVGQKDWAKREYRNVRRIKLEELLVKKGDCDAYLDRLRAKTIEAEYLNDRQPDSDLRMLAALYFPELHDAVGSCVKVFREELSLGHEAFAELMVAKQITGELDLPTHHGITTKYVENLKPIWDASNTADQHLKTAAAKLLREIMDVA